MLGGSMTKSKKRKFKDGDLSAILLDEFPFWVNYHRVPDINTALMKEWDEKLDKIAKQAINKIMSMSINLCPHFSIRTLPN